MSSSSRSVTNQVKAARVQDRNPNSPKWLKGLLEMSFFDNCLAHPIRRNELNKYCMNCKVSLCQYCLTSGAHRSHKVLKIYRHVYTDVVSLGTMEKHLDCSKIQPYKSNKRLIIALTPLPHSGPTLSNEVSCETCKRRLADPHLYSYCSMACKVKAFSKNKPSRIVCVESPNKENRENIDKLKLERPLHKRKGTPFRAPFF